MKKLLLSAGLLLASYAVFAQQTPASSGSNSDSVKVEKRVSTTTHSSHEASGNKVEKKSSANESHSNVSTQKSTSTEQYSKDGANKTNRSYKSTTKRKYEKRDTVQ